MKAFVPSKVKLASETIVLELIGENIDSPDVFVDTEMGLKQIRDSIGSAIEDISLITGGAQRKYHIPLEANMMFYRITSDLDNIAYPKSVYLINQKRKLYQKDFIWLNWYNPSWLQETGTPCHYVFIGKDLICINPTPTSNTDMLMIDAVVIPTRYSDEQDEIKVRDSFQWALAHYAVSEYYASRGDAKSAVEHFTKFLDRASLQRFYPSAFERSYGLGRSKGEDKKIS